MNSDIQAWKKLERQTRNGGMALALIGAGFAAVSGGTTLEFENVGIILMIAAVILFQLSNRAVIRLQQMGSE